MAVDFCEEKNLRTLFSMWNFPLKLFSLTKTICMSIFTSKFLFSYLFLIFFGIRLSLILNSISELLFEFYEEYYYMCISFLLYIWIIYIYYIFGYKNFIFFFQHIEKLVKIKSSNDLKGSICHIYCHIHQMCTLQTKNFLSYLTCQLSNSKYFKIFFFAIFEYT